MEVPGHRPAKPIHGRAAVAVRFLPLLIVIATAAVAIAVVAVADERERERERDGATKAIEAGGASRSERATN